MRTFNILFTSVGRRLELVRAFRRAYATLGISGRIVAVDIDPLAPALQEVDRFYMVPRLSEPGYVPALAEICRREQIGLVFPLIDPDIPVLARARKVIEATGARLAVVSEEAAGITADKWQTYEFFLRVGVSTPRSWLPDDLRTDDLAYPVFIKPRFGSAGKHACPAGNPRELGFFLSRVPQPIVQEYLPGPEITSDVVCDLNGTILAVVSRRRIEVRSGEVAKGVTIYDPAVAEACARIAQGLPAVGPITVQCMMKNGAPHFTEINARLGGGIPLAIAAGVDVPAWILARATGMQVEIPPVGTYRTGLYMTRYDESFFFDEDRRARIESSRL
ncbi:MAG: ATP-grasp domain-containing protein [Chloroflexi bacterium]|nr:ATP-grasp domain-containing protein [Chloroflexota bacterium]